MELYQNEENEEEEVEIGNANRTTDVVNVYICVFEQWTLNSHTQNLTRAFGFTRNKLAIGCQTDIYIQLRCGRKSYLI